MKGHACPTCTKLKRDIGNRLNDDRDVKKKLIRVDTSNSARADHLRAQAADVKARLDNARTKFGAHQAECDVALAAPKSKKRGGPHAKIVLPLDELAALRAEGLTLDELAERYGCSPGVISRNLGHTSRPLLVPEVGDLSWQEDALCAQTDPESFFPEKGGSTREAKKVCQSCEVREPCLKYALDHDERFGIYGGLSERERRKLKKRGAA